MKKITALLALLMTVACLLAGCGDKYAEEKTALQGTWQGTMDVTEQANEELQDTFLSLMGKTDRRTKDILRSFDELQLTVLLTIDPDGCYHLEVSEASVQECFRRAQLLSKGMVADYCRRIMDDAGKDVLPEDMVEAAGVPLDRVDQQLDERFNAPKIRAAIHRLRQEGYCTVSGEGLELADESGAQAHTICGYTLEEGVLKLETIEGELPDFCPDTLVKI